MKVEAVKPGFYRRVYRAGEVFDVPEKNFSETWMKKVGKEDGSTGKKSGRKRQPEVLPEEPPETGEGEGA